jgi:hypothetical protein
MSTQLALPLLTGRQRRDSAHAAQQRRYHEWLQSVRLVAARVAWSNGQVCADDVAHLPLPDGASPNVRGGLFNSPWFEFAGFTRSRRPEAHHNRLNCYRLTTAGVDVIEGVRR